MALTDLPFHLPGRIYRCPMPFGPYDPDGEVYRQFGPAEIHAVVLLVSDEECLKKSGRDLRSLYLQDGLQVISLPIPDFSVPDLPELEKAVEALYRLAQAGTNTAVHCTAGVGRTGLVLACLAKKALGLNGDEAVQWVRQQIPGAVETREQVRLVSAYPAPASQGEGE